MPLLKCSGPTTYGRSTIADGRTDGLTAEELRCRKRVVRAHNVHRALKRIIPRWHRYCLMSAILSTAR